MASVFYFCGLICAAVAAYVGYDAETMDVILDGAANLQLMHVQSSKLSFALAFAVIAALLISVGAIVQVLKEKS